jgi:non-specific serine/threonine protein kinase
MDHDVSFGQWLERRRRALHLSRAELAARVACAAVTLRKIEEDARRPSPELAARIAEHLDLPVAARADFIRAARRERSVASLPPPEIAEPRRPPRAAPPVAPTNLPALLTSFVGRNRELKELLHLVSLRRLITITGAGGIGKTRLATEAGLAILKRGRSFPDGVWLVELAPLAQPDLVAPAIAQALGLPQEAGRGGIDALQSFLAQKKLLLILDNCEHLIDACAATAERLLQRCWNLHIIATSREELRVAGELIFATPPLPLPEASVDRPAQLHGTAAHLFIERIGTPAGYDTPAELSAISAICRRLDGMPLAIELAAPLARRMPVAEIATQLADQMRLLKSDSRTGTPRHETMQRALAWSYRLLTPREQHLLLRAAVFASGWTLPALQAICSDTEGAHVAMTLDQLVRRSLVLAATPGEERRYRMLEPVRQFAAELLAESGEYEAIRRRHAVYFFGLAEQMSAARDTPQERVWLERLEPERDNLRAVNLWAFAHGEREFAQRFNGALFAFWIYRSSIPEANDWLGGALALAERAVGADAQASAREAEASALNAAGYAASMLPDYAQAQRWFARELELRTSIGDPQGIATALRGLSCTAMLRGALDDAERYIQQAFAMSQQAGDHGGVAWALFDIGYLAFVRDELAAARPMLEEGLAHLLERGINFGAYRALLALGHVERGLGERQRAAARYAEALRLQQQMRYLHYVADGLEGLGGIAAEHGDGRMAARLVGAADAHRRSIAMPRWPHHEAGYAADLAYARSLIDTEEWEEAWEAGAATLLEQAVAAALAYAVAQSA